jgi:hypothetical protein
MTEASWTLDRRNPKTCCISTAAKTVAPGSPSRERLRTDGPEAETGGAPAAGVRPEREFALTRTAARQHRGGGWSQLAWSEVRAALRSSPLLREREKLVRPLLSDNALFETFGQRALTQAVFGGSDFGECVTTIERVGDGTVDDLTGSGSRPLAASSR